MKDKSDVLKKAHMDKWKRIFLFTITAIFIYFIMLTVVTPKRYKLNEGDIATVDIKAPRDIIDEEATKAKEQEVTAKVEKKFTLKNEIKIEASENIKSFFDKLINLKSNDIDEKSKISELKKIDAFKLSDAEYKTLLDLNVDKDTELQWIALTAIDKGYEKQIEEDNSEDIAEAKTIVDDYLSSQELESNIEVQLNGENSSAQIVSRSVGKGNSVQTFHPNAIGNNKCQAHIQCDSIIMDKAEVGSIPEIRAKNIDAAIIHEAAIGRINDEQLLKLRTLGLTEEEAEAVIIQNFLN